VWKVRVWMIRVNWWLNVFTLCLCVSVVNSLLPDDKVEDKVEDKVSVFDWRQDAAITGTLEARRYVAAAILFPFTSYDSWLKNFFAPHVSA
jgi:hypothetical protein